MLHAIEKNKAGLNFSNKEINWRELFKTSEDSLTSSVFERLFYLPVELFWKILSDSCYDDNLPKYCGPILLKEFWPRWNAEGTANSLLVEPDLFISFSEFDLIIEAKRRNDNQQNRAQWIAERQAYENEYGELNKPVFIIALGGLNTEKSEIISFETKVVKSRWKRILSNVQLVHKGLLSTNGYISGNDSVKVILEDLITVFQLHGYSVGEWFNTWSLHGNKLTKYENAFKTLTSK